MADEDTSRGVGCFAILGIILFKFCATLTDNVARHSDDFFRCSRNVEDVNPRIFEDLKPIKTDEVFDIRLNEPEMSSEIFDDEIPILKKDEFNKITLSNKLDNRFTSISEVTLEETTVIVDWDISHEEVELLNRKGVKFICDLEIYKKQKDIKNFKIFLAYSDDKNVLKRMYSINDQQADEVRKYAESIKNNDRIEIVSNEDEIEMRINECINSSITPLVVYHNKADSKISETLYNLGVENIITCKSYSNSHKKFYATSDYIGIKNVFNSLAAAEKNSNLINFYKDFANHYCNAIEADRKKNVTVVFAGATATTGAGCLIYYNNKK